MAKGLCYMISFLKKKASQLNPQPKQGCKLVVLLKGYANFCSQINIRL
jgi:hypothetical protein